MHERYRRQKMTANWSDQQRYDLIALVEEAVLRARVKLGMITVSIPGQLGDLAKTLVINVDEIYRLEREETGHDVVAFLELTSPQLPEELRPHWHERLTTMDPQDTALSLQLMRSVDILIEDIGELSEAVKQRALEHKHTIMIGRTHGVHGEPITFGFKLANFYVQLQRSRKRLLRLREDLSVGKVSGTMGIYALDPEVERVTCEMLGLKPVVATQIIGRDLIAEYMAVLAIIAGEIERFATTIRTLQRTEIRELEEPRSSRQRGSSAMPHKRNPVGCENLCGLARVVRNNLGACLETISTWDERDISNSSLERIELPGTSELVDYMLGRMTGIIRGLKVFPERMFQNLEMTKGLIYSQDVVSLITRKSGLSKQEAYAFVFDVAQRCWDENGDFLKALLATEYIMQYVNEEDIRECFNLEEKIKHIDHVFNQAFGTSGS